MTIDLIQLTPEQIAQYRSELANSHEALAAFDVIEEWDGDLADATESIAIRNGIEGVEDNADFRWFVKILREISDFLCQPKYRVLRGIYVPELIRPVADRLLYLGCSEGVAIMIATPIVVYVALEGTEKVCQLIHNSKH